MKLYYFIISLFCKHKYLVDTYKAKYKYKYFKGKYRPVFYIVVSTKCECCKKQLGSTKKVKSNLNKFQVNQFYNKLINEDNLEIR